MSKKTPFIKVPQKLFELGLDPYEIALFTALASHRSGSYPVVFPSWDRLVELTCMSRSKVYRSLKVLHACKVIVWEQGHTGYSNRYRFTNTTVWIKKVNDKAVDKSVDNSEGVVSQGHGG